MDNVHITGNLAYLDFDFYDIEIDNKKYTFTLYFRNMLNTDYLSDSQKYWHKEGLEIGVFTNDSYLQMAYGRKKWWYFVDNFNLEYHNFNFISEYINKAIFICQYIIGNRSECSDNINFPLTINPYTGYHYLYNITGDIKEIFDLITIFEEKYSKIEKTIFSLFNPISKVKITNFEQLNTIINKWKLCIDYDIITNEIETKSDKIIYFLINRNKIVYIGKTEAKWPNRINQHKKDKEFNKVQAISFNNVTHKQLMIFEAFFINLLKPKYNSKLTFNIFIKRQKELLQEAS